MKAKFLKIVLWVLALLAVLVLSLGVYGYFTVKRSLAPQAGTLSLTQLRQPVTIWRDSMGVPQIIARNEHDGYFALGYLHASDRLFQIDLTRRVAEGRLSALFGSLTLDIDRHQRLIGHARLAQKFLSRLSPEDRARLQAYVDGVNRYVAEAKTLPFEYHLLGVPFEPYTLKDVLSILSFQTWFSNALLSSDEWLAKIFDRFGPDTAATLALPYPTWAPVTVPQVPAPQAGFSVLLFNTYFSDVKLPFRMAHSSNSWVISPSHSASKHAMLASDPHLETQRLPQFWYLVGLHIQSPKADVLGITTPGLPFVVMGHNGKAAWAFTVGGIDITEVYLEKVNPNDSTMYLTSSGWKKFKVRKESIFVKGKEKPIAFRMRFTENGPIVWENDSLKHVYSLHWAGFDVDLARTVRAAFHLRDVDNFDDFRQTVTHFGALDANWTYADFRGNIGYQLGTPIPVRPKSVFKLPIPGWIDSLKWRGFHPLSETPHSFNPQRGWLATSNNKQDAMHLHYRLFGKFAADRILRITELLSSKEIFTFEDMKRFQMDRVDRFLQHWQPVLSGLLQKLGKENYARMISQWDGSANAQSKEAALVILFKNRLKHKIFDDQLGKLTKHISDEDLLHVFNQGPNFWFDDVRTPDSVETRSDIAQMALKEALSLWQEQTWGELQSFTMAHPMAKVPVIGSLLGLKKGPFPWGGTPGTLNASFYEEDPTRPGHFKSIVGPSWRFVIDFAHPDSAEFVLPAGESGNPESPFFLNFFSWWKSGKRWNVPISLPAIKKKAVFKLILTPEGNNETK